MWQLRLNSVKEPLVHLIHKKEGGGRNHAHFYPPIFFLSFTCTYYFPLLHLFSSWKRQHIQPGQKDPCGLPLDIEMQREEQESGKCNSLPSNKPGPKCSHFSLLCVYVCVLCQYLLPSREQKDKSQKREREREREIVDSPLTQVVSLVPQLAEDHVWKVTRRMMLMLLLMLFLLWHFFYFWSD